MRPKILDFGLAGAAPGCAGGADHASRPSLEVGRVAGTVAYMAPEVLRGGAANERSDLRSLGVLLYEMLRGELPFQRRGTYEVAAAILERARASLPAPIPASLSRLVMRLPEKDPADRYRRAAELKAVLESLLDDEPVSAPPKARARRAPQAMAGAIAL